MKFKTAIAFGLVLAGVAAFAPANAATYIWTYTDTGANQVGSGHLTTNTAAYTNGNVTSISGSVFGDTITGLVPNPNAPNQSTSGDGLFYYDNTLTFPAPNVTNAGLLFTVASATVSGYNLFSDTASVYELYPYFNGNYGTLSNPGLGTQTYGNFSVTAVPEPAVWAMLLLGFGFVGFMMRSARRNLQGLAKA